MSETHQGTYSTSCIKVLALTHLFKDSEHTFLHAVTSFDHDLPTDDVFKNVLFSVVKWNGNVFMAMHLPKVHHGSVMFSLPGSASHQDSNWLHTMP